MQLFIYRADKKETEVAFKRTYKRFQKNKEYFVISHKLDHDHMIDWNNTIILDSEQSYNKWMVSEIIHIKR